MRKLKLGEVHANNKKRENVKLPVDRGIKVEMPSETCW